MNGVVGVGIFFAPAQVAGLVPGPLGAAAYVLTAAALLPVAAVFARLGSRMAEDGGPYVWASHAFGARAGFYVGWLSYVAALFSTAAVLRGLATHVAPEVLGAGTWRPVALTTLVVLATIVATGLRPTAVVWTAFSVLKIVPLVLLVTITLLVVTPASAGSEATVSDGGPANLARAALVVLFSMQGFEVVPVLAGKAAPGGRAVAMATVGTLVITTGLYVAIHLSCVRAVPDLAGASAPLVDAAGAGGGWLRPVMAVGTNVSALGVAFGMVAVTPVYLAVLRRHGGVFRWLQAGSDQRRALAITALLLMALLLVDGGNLFALSSVAVLGQYLVASASLGWMALRRRAGFKPRDALPVPLAMVTAAVLVVGARPLELAIAAVFLGLGALLYRAAPAPAAAP